MNREAPFELERVQSKLTHRLLLGRGRILSLRGANLKQAIILMHIQLRLHMGQAHTRGLLGI